MGSEHAQRPDNMDCVLIGCKCTDCGRVFFPTREVCTVCGSEKPMAEAVIDGPGTLYSHSIIHIAPKTFEVPYAVGYVDLPGEVRVLGQIEGWQDFDLKQGMTMEIGRAQIATEADGSARHSFVFRPVR